MKKASYKGMKSPNFVKYKHRFVNERKIITFWHMSRW